MTAPHQDYIRLLEDFALRMIGDYWQRQIDLLNWACRRDDYFKWYRGQNPFERLHTRQPD